MKVEIYLRDLASDETRSLAAWLAADSEVARSVRGVGQSPSSESGHMGVDLLVVNAVVANAIALGVLVSSIVAWRKTSAAAPTVIIRSDEKIVEIKGITQDDVDVIVARLLNRDTEKDSEPGSNADAV